MPSGSENTERQTKKTSATGERTLKYFEVVSKENCSFKCVVNDCHKILKGGKIWNLSVHLRNVHPKLYEEFVAPPCNKKYYKIKRLKFIQNCAEIIGINGRPFTALNDSGFRKIVENNLDELRQHDAGINMDDKNCTEIKQYIESVVVKLKNKIKIETKAKFVSLMVDIARKNDRSFLGLNVQYTIDDAVELKLLGMIELNQAHTSLYIKEVMQSCLRQYDISMDQVISITTDNGANMLAMIDRFNDEDDEDDDGGELSTLNRSMEDRNINDVAESIRTNATSSSIDDENVITESVSLINQDTIDFF